MPGIVPRPNLAPGSTTPRTCTSGSCSLESASSSTTPGLCTPEELSIRVTSVSQGGCVEHMWTKIHTGASTGFSDTSSIALDRYLSSLDCNLLPSRKGYRSVLPPVRPANLSLGQSRKQTRSISPIPVPRSLAEKVSFAAVGPIDAGGYALSPE